MACYTVVGILVYNGRRPSVIQRLTISNFTKSSTASKVNPELFEGRVNDNHYTWCIFRGNLARNVSIVLRSQMYKMHSDSSRISGC